MKNTRISTSIEVLEARIAPASFLVSASSAGPNALKILSSAGVPVADVDSVAANALFSADASVLLNANDVLYFDSNNNGVINIGADRFLAKATAGKMRVFFDDLNTSGRFEPGDLAGVATTGGINAQIDADVNGDVAVLLDASGKFVQGVGGLVMPAGGAVVKLNVQGAIFGNLTAPGDIKNVTIGALLNPGHLGLTPTDVLQIPSVRFIGAGTNNTGAFTLGVGIFVGGTQNLLPLVLAPGTNGANIEQITLARGAEGIFAGGGVSIANGAGGKGGNIEGVTFTATPLDFQAGDFGIMAGHGGNGSTQGGAGGNIINPNMNITGPGLLNLDAGQGGVGGAGGLGGSITGVLTKSINFYNNRDIAIVAHAGDGGISSGSNAGGLGGSIKTLKINGYGVFPGGDSGAELHAGAGGSNVGAGGTGNGGAGGSVVGVSVQAFNAASALFNFIAIGGDAGFGGASGGRGGDGGGVTNTSFKSAGPMPAGSLIHVLSGHAGNGLGGGGAGGTLNGVAVSVPNAVETEVEFIARDGGKPLGNTATVFANGGSILGSSLSIGGKGSILIKAGDAGDTTGRTVRGGNGGSIVNFNMNLNGFDPDGSTVEILAGHGMAAGAPAADLNGGNGGEINTVTVKSSGLAGYLSIHSGNGGDAEGNGDGGTGGRVFKLSLIGTAVDAFRDGVDILAGTGGSGGSGTGAAKGGDGGTVSKLAINTQDIGGLSIYAGPGGAGGGTGIGGKGGGIVESPNLILGDAPGGVILAAQAGGDSEKTPGVGGVVGNISLTAGDIGGEVSVWAGAGGNFYKNGAPGSGAAGGAISQVNFTVGNVVGSIVRFLAGNGGGTTDQGTSGSGGAVSNLVFTSGAITDAQTGLTDNTPSNFLSLAVAGGNGGNAGPKSAGGTGGAVLNSKVDVQGTVAGGIHVSGGYGAASNVVALFAAQAGGDGGMLKKVEVFTSSGVGAGTTQPEGITLQSGRGGTSNNGKGGNAGILDNLFLSVGGLVAGDVLIATREGGDGKTDGGDGGSIKKVTVDNFAEDSLYIVSSDAGASQGATTKGGDVSQVTITSYAQADIEIQAGSAREFDGAGLTGGAGGSVLDTSITDYAGSQVFVRAGGGGGPQTNLTSHGGLGGDIRDLTIEGISTNFRIASGHGGSAMMGGTGKGGEGGEVEDLKSSNGVDVVAIYGGFGGGGEIGADGGDVSKVNLAYVGTTAFEIIAGSGGNGGSGASAVAGRGGSVFDIDVNGAIGDSSAPFGIEGIAGGSFGPGGSSVSGGLAAGLGGFTTPLAGPQIHANNGSVKNVTATSISAILAVGADYHFSNLDELAITNAVFSIANIQAGAIGYDTDGDGIMDFGEIIVSNTFELGVGDAPTDGFVIVRAAGLTGTSFAAGSAPTFLITI